MVVKKSNVFLILIISILVIFIGRLIKPVKLESSTIKYKIGISQIAEHPALDLSREGFIEGLNSKGFVSGENIDIEIQNSQGDIATSQMIAQRFGALKKDIIFAIGTPSAQTVYNNTKTTPIIVTAITDIVSSGIVKSKEDMNNNVAGTSDLVPISKQLELLKKIIPKAKKVGVIYNTSELNSEVQIRNMKDIAPKYDLEIVSAGINNTNELSQVLDSIVNTVDALYIPTDNLVASSMPLIYSKFSSKNKPIFGAEEAHVKSGALATDGISYYNLGFQSGVMAAEVLEGKDIETMKVEELKDTQIVINKQVCKKLNIDIPKDILDKAIIVGEVQ